MPAWCGSTAATSSRSGSSATARHPVDPTRPPAPNTPTRTMSGDYRPSPGSGISRGSGEVIGVERADDRKGPRLVDDHPPDHPGDVVDRDGVDIGDELVEGRDV